MGKNQLPDGISRGEAEESPRSQNRLVKDDGGDFTGSFEDKMEMHDARLPVCRGGGSGKKSENGEGE